LIIPAINCPDFTGASRNIRLAERFLPPSIGWIHIDVSDGKYTKTKSWGDVHDFITLNLRLNIEVHLMVEDIEKRVHDWLRVGARRIIVPVEKINEDLIKQVKAGGAELVPSLDINTAKEDALPYLNKFNYVNLLTVPAGPSGHKMSSGAPKKIEFLRGENRGVKIEVDGGVDPETAIQFLGVGADILVSGSYIFESPDPSQAYRELELLI